MRPSIVAVETNYGGDLLLGEVQRRLAGLHVTVRPSVTSAPPVSDTEFWSRWDHWLIFDEDRRIVRCHCGVEADPSDEGWGDSIVRHLRIEALRDAGVEVVD